jgi:hypothetical protein
MTLADAESKVQEHRQSGKKHGCEVGRAGKNWNTQG